MEKILILKAACDTLNLSSKIIIDRIFIEGGKGILKTKNFIDGSMISIHFGKTVGAEINNEHYSIVFNIKNNDNMVFCIPLTSPKMKHFKTEKDFNERNYLQLKYPHTYYIAQTDSIALIDQLRVISIDRLRHFHTDPTTGKMITLYPEELDIIKLKVEKFIKSILHKK